MKAYHVFKIAVRKSKYSSCYICANNVDEAMEVLKIAYNLKDLDGYVELKKIEFADKAKGLILHSIDLERCTKVGYFNSHVLLQDCVFYGEHSFWYPFVEVNVRKHYIDIISKLL